MNETVALTLPGAGYDTDFHAWSLQQAELLRAGRFDLIDIENMSEEIESLARRDRQKVVSCMTLVIEDLLKLKYSPARNPRGGWRRTIANQRQQLDMILSDSPSLQSRQAEFFEKAWSQGIKLARLGLEDADETAAAAMVAAVANTPCFSIDQVLDPDFLPKA